MYITIIFMTSHNINYISLFYYIIFNVLIFLVTHLKLFATRIRVTILLLRNAVICTHVAYIYIILCTRKGIGRISASLCPKNYHIISNKNKVCRPDSHLKNAITAIEEKKLLLLQYYMHISLYIGIVTINSRFDRESITLCLQRL